MSDWLKVKAADVVELIERRKDRLPWGYRPEEIYRCLIFQKDGRVVMTVESGPQGRKPRLCLSSSLYR